MLPRLLLFATLALLGCDDDPPPDERPVTPGEGLPSVAPDSVGVEPSTELLLDPEPDTGAVTIHHADGAPPAPLPLSGVVGSCDARPTAPLCFAFTGPGWTLAAAQSECAEAEGGVFQSAACPTEERIGECVYRPEGDAAREVVHTFYAPMDPLVAEGVCRGVFRAL